MEPIQNYCKGFHAAVPLSLKSIQTVNSSSQRLSVSFVPCYILTSLRSNIHIQLVNSYTCLWRGTILWNYGPYYFWLCFFIYYKQDQRCRPLVKSMILAETTASIIYACHLLWNKERAECAALLCASCRSSWETDQRKVSAGCTFQVKLEINVGVLSKL